MAIQLPRIQEDQSGPSIASAPDISAQPLNTTGPMNQAQGATQAAAQEIVNYQKDQMFHEADNIASNASNAYLTWKQKRLYGDPGDPQNGVPATVGLYNQEGNPKDNYTQFNKENEAKLKELSTAPDGQDWSGMTQNIVNRRLNHYSQQVKDESLVQFGYAQQKFDSQTSKTSQNLAAQQMMVHSSSVDPAHPESMNPMQGDIADIKAAAVNYALKGYGGAVQPKNADGSPVTGDDGKPVPVQMTPYLDAQIRKNVSDSLASTIKNLYTSDQGDGKAIDQANAIKDHFADQILPGAHDDLKKSQQSAVLDKEANGLAGQAVSQKDPGKFIDSSGQSFDVRSKALEKAMAYTGRMQQDGKQQSSQMFSVVMPTIRQAMNGPNPYVNLQDAMDRNPLVKNAFANDSKLQPKDLNTITSAITGGPAQTSAVAAQKWQDIKNGNVPGQTIQGMTEDQKDHLLAGFNSKQRASEEAYYNKMNTSPDASQIQQIRQQTSQQLQQMGTAMKLYNEDPNHVGKVAPGGDDSNRYNNDVDQLMQAQSGSKVNPDQISSNVRQFIQSKLQGKVFNQGQLPFTKGSMTQSAAQANDPIFDTLAPKQISVYQKAYMNQTGNKIDASTFRKDPAFTKFVRQQMAQGN